MLLAGKVVTKFAAARSVNQSFTRLFMATPPRVRISFPEKVLHGTIFAIGVLAVPTYISVNIKHYRGPVESIE